jgi:transposase
LTQKPIPYSLAEATHILGDDFGFANTSAQAIVPIDRPLSIEFFEEASTWTKSQAKNYLETHTREILRISNDGEAVQEILHSGRNFLSAIKNHALHIDKLRGEIDCLYNRFMRIKETVCREFVIPLQDKIDFTMKTSDKRLSHLLSKLAMLMKQVTHLKHLRRKLYRTVDGIKKSWFGWLSNRKAETARYYHAVVVREDLTILTIEKDDPAYKGRTFNKMLNNGAKGQYLRIASGKLKWYGIPELTVPSFFTSCTDIKNGVVDKKQRKSQDKFVSAVTGESQQADIHAALTIALLVNR